MPASTRLPGIQFDVVAPPTAEPFVRMDIAVFVGFAASGPLQQPVAVEDIARFEEIFGDDLPIANDATSGQPVNAYLPSAVRAFFRNGGRRCWVIRVAGPGAVASRFPIPGVEQLKGDKTVPAYGQARSEGSWSDSLAVGVALRSQAIEVIRLGGDFHSIDLLLGRVDDVIPGDLLKLTFGGSGDVLWFFVDTVTAATNASPPPSSNRDRLVTVFGQNTLWQPLNSLPLQGLAPTCERLTMDMFAQSDSGAWTLSNLGFAPAHPRYWAALPTDAELYDSETPQGLSAEAAHPRFPIAGEDDQGFYLPLSVGPLPQTFNGPELENAADPIERDGLSVFGMSLFLDPALADSSSIDLLQQADYIRYQSSQPRALTGIHAALAIEEATLIAVPDAVQRGWIRVEPVSLTSPPESSPLAHPEWWHFLDCHQTQDIPRIAKPPLGQFEPCDLLLVDPPSLQITDVKGGRFSLTWTAMSGAVDYLEEAVDPEFVTTAVIYQGASGSVTIYGRPPGDYYYRLRRQIGNVSSNYSNGVGLRIKGPRDWQVNPVQQYKSDTLLAVQGALLRMSAARGDVFAVLTMPQHYRESEAMAHAAKLKSALDSAEQLAYSFGALYHPWLTGREENDLLNLRSNPPDGAVAGIMAMRSSQRGPWISPANETLHGVVDLTPAVSKNARQALQDSLINLVRQEPGGFVCLCALTLSDDPDLQPVNVRRLLSFLRKTALREGVNYVFEPNGDEFRRRVQRGFESLFGRLQLRGAFAGRTARESFQVVTDSTLNTPEALANGKFIVELRVAPSVPLRFLTIRLLQTADRTFVTEGG